MLTGLFLEHVACRHKRRRILLRDQRRPLGEGMFPLSHLPLIPHDCDGDDAAAPDFGADVPPPPPIVLPPFSALYRRIARRRPTPFVPGMTENGQTVIGSDAGFGALAGSAVRAPTPKQMARASDERWYDGS